MSHLRFEERLYIETELKKGTKIHEISLGLKRNYKTIFDQVNDNGGMENYNAEKSQLNHDEIVSKTASMNGKKAYKTKASLKDRIDGLEMQIDILMDLFKEKK